MGKFLIHSGSFKESYLRDGPSMKTIFDPLSYFGVSFWKMSRVSELDFDPFLLWFAIISESKFGIKS